MNIHILYVTENTLLLVHEGEGAINGRDLVGFLVNAFNMKPSVTVQQMRSTCSGATPETACIIQNISSVMDRSSVGMTHISAPHFSSVTPMYREKLPPTFLSVGLMRENNNSHHTLTNS